MHTTLVSTVHHRLIQVSHSHTKLSTVHFDQSQRSTDDGILHLPLPSHLKFISSPSNPFVKHCVKLRQSSSYRHLHRSALVVGTTPIREILEFQGLRQGPSKVDCLLLLDGAEVPKGLCDSYVRILHVNSMVMRKLSGVQSSDSIETVALMRIPTSFCNMEDNQRETNFRNWFPSPHRILVLDGIQDGVFLLPGCCDPFNEKVLRAARGASFQLPIVSGKWVHLEALTTEFEMKLLAGHPESMGESKCSSSISKKLVSCLADKPLCLILGSEGHGLSDQSRQACELINIPMAGGFESLNVSVAGGIFLFLLQPENRIFI
ncbi:PREDICTED: uncharacterized protein LOC104595531 isoform X2 [Nelumbo nucifera]|uniref:Uncharacterized protein LOC104595531 isoform X2 n=1 Tax=Nelumbo nucifera TaxID=4432 RepID=A0A1U7ZMS4_NELNU|nr:PREDICTED: uncharacterized protein LOC104595531 isoform X2 [Nelumbo nucifera]